MLAVRCVTVVIALGAWVFLLVRVTTSASGLVIGVAVSLVYLAIAAAYRPEPDTSDLGWLGGLVDNPFRFSDNINRFLLFLLIVLWPGRLVADALADLRRATHGT